MNLSNKKHSKTYSMLQILTVCVTLFNNKIETVIKSKLLMAYSALMGASRIYK